MTYTDTLYLITLSSPRVCEKKADEKVIGEAVNQALIDELIACGKTMRDELGRVTDQVDSLKFVSEMPYICQMELCGDPLYWEVVRLRLGAAELLIDKLDDTTLTEANVKFWSYKYTTADIAFSALKEIIHGIPTFELLGVPFDKEGCGYCAYWQHLNEDFKNRQRFKQAVWEWYHQNRENLVWVTSHTFTS